MTVTPDSLSQARLASNPVPNDMAVLLERYQSQLSNLGLFISDDPNVMPWGDESYLTESDWANPDIAANIKAMRDTNELVYFVGYSDNGESFGIWCIDSSDDLEQCPPVTLDTEGQYETYPTWADCLRRLLCDAPICDQIQQDTGNFPEPTVKPNTYRDERYNHYLKQPGNGI